jgi:DNA-binding transcriptional ArsR family regulator
MLELALDLDDVARIRLAGSPLMELTSSLVVLHDARRHALHEPWVRRAQPIVEHDDQRLLRALTAPNGWQPDFLNPRPGDQLAEPAGELAALRRTPPGTVRRDLQVAYDGRSLPPVLRGDADVVLSQIVDALERYWNACLAPHWPRMRALLQADIRHRTRQLARGGLERLFADLDPRLGWSDGTLRVDLARQGRRTGDGHGLPLVPALFAHKPRVYLARDLPPLIAYPARGAALLWDEGAGLPGALRGLLGAGRAAVLMALDEPRTTTEIATLLGVAPATVSQHLKALAAATLAEPTRYGRAVLYSTTALGEALRVLE